MSRLNRDNKPVHRTEVISSGRLFDELMPGPAHDELKRRLHLLENTKSRAQIAAGRLARSDRVEYTIMVDRLHALENLPEVPPAGKEAFPYPYPFLDKDDFLLYIADMLNLDFETVRNLDHGHNNQTQTAMSYEFFRDVFAASAVENMPPIGDN